MQLFSAARLGAATALAICAVLAASKTGQTTVVSGPSFDCTNAMLPTENAICTDPQLAAIDLLIEEAYRTFEPAYGGDKKTIARSLIADRNACGSDTACIAVALANALQTYGLTPAWVDHYTLGLIGKKALDIAEAAPKHADQPLPETLGGCAVTHIAELTTRFGEPLEGADAGAGSGVTFVNGGRLVSYSVEDGLAASQVGNAVAVCLLSIPRDCPAGDERGRMYYTVNLITQGTWALPDSQHMCGGA